jgi:transcriptional regulator with XRE-family HTH domain
VASQPSLGQLLRDARQSAALTQEALAARAGLSTRAISDLERGINHTPRTTTVQLLVRALGLSEQEREHFETVARAHQTNSPTATRAGYSAADALAAPVTGTALAYPPPLIGRAHERTIVQHHLTGLGSPLLVVAGEPGIGKTRLLQEAANMARALRMTIVSGTVPSSVESTSLDPIADALRHSIQDRSPVLLRRDLQGCGSLVQIIPELAAMDCVPPESSSSGLDEATAASAVARFLMNTAGPAGTLLALDNLERAGEPALILLARLVRSSYELPVRIVAGYRDGHCTGRDPLSALLATFAHEQLVKHIALSPLTTREAADLLLAVNGQRGQEMGPWPARALLDSGGIPFHIVAWAEHLGAASQQHGTAPVPWAIQQTVRHRMDAGPSVRPVLEALAVAGGRATLNVLAAVVGRPERELLTALEWSLRDRLITEVDQAYAFAYGVIHDAVDLDLSPARRDFMRRRLAGLTASDLADDLADNVAKRRARTTEGTQMNERMYHLEVLRRARAGRGERQPSGD